MNIMSKLKKTVRIMEKFENIDQYCKKTFMSVEDMKDMILTSALNLGCEAAHNFEENPHQTEQVFTTLHFFNDILDNVK